MSDINPQWRLLALTESFGPVGMGWYSEVVDRTVLTTENGEMVVFVTVQIRYSTQDATSWSQPVEGTGGAKIAAMEKNGLHVSTEAFKMAETDAIGKACAKLGIAADIYLGQMDTKYAMEQEKPDPKKEGIYKELTERLYQFDEYDECKAWVFNAVNIKYVEDSLGKGSKLMQQFSKVCSTYLASLNPMNQDKK